jgi:GT2 family glycosyltransferase
LAVVIPTWNSVDLVGPCLDGVRAQGLEVELLAVDNGSTDGTVSLLEREGIRHVDFSVNRGFAVAVNRGVAHTRAAAVLVLNVDAVMELGCLRALAATLEADPSLAGVQPRILQAERGVAPPVEEARLYSAGQALTADGRAFEVGAGLPQSKRLLDRGEIFGVCGAACLFRRDVFELLGGYDETYFSFYEDVDLNVRARIAGRGFQFVPNAVVWHLGNASWQQQFVRPGAENARLVARNRLSTQIKYMPAAALPRIAAVEVGSLARAAREHRLRATLRGKLEALGRLPRLLRERSRLRRTGEPRLAREWLGRGSLSDVE